MRYVTDNNIRDIKNILSRDIAKKEIILLDDFLGQHYLKLNERQPNELKSLISFVEKNPNKKIIMNSRITIINEAYSSSLDFANLFDNYEKDNYLIDLDQMSFLEKAQILYNHLYFNDLPVAFLLNVKKDKNYLSIVKHKNYNPRIIEFVTKTKNYINVPPDNYVEYIMSKLNNPDSVWEDEFRNRLEEYDRILLNTIYSLTNDKIEINIVEKDFNKRLLTVTNNTTLNIFDEVINRLNNSLIKIIVDRRKRYISVINPSVNDFLNKKIFNNPNEQVIIINNARYIEQLIKFKQNKNQIYKFIYDNSINELDSIDKSTSYRYFELLLDYQIKDLKIKSFVQRSFRKLCDDYHFGKDDLIIELIEKGYIDFYELKEILFKDLKYTLYNFSYDNTLLFYKWILSIDIKKDNLLIIKEKFIDTIQYYVLSSINDDIQETVSADIQALNFKVDTLECRTIEDLKNLYVNEYYDYINDDIKQEINEITKKILRECPIDLNINEIDNDYILYNINIDDSIRSYVDNKYNDWQVNSYVENEKSRVEEDQWKKIDEMFSL